MYAAKDGRKFANSYQGRAYDRGRELIANAPGGPSHEQSLREHGFVKELRIVREANGRHRIVAVHNDGHQFTEVHPDGYRAHNLAGKLLQLPETPSFEVHQRTRAHPSGPKEDERIAREDRRTPEPIIPGLTLEDDR